MILTENLTTKKRQLNIRSDILEYYDKKARDLQCTKLEDLFEKLYNDKHIQKILGDLHAKPPIIT